MIDWQSIDWPTVINLFAALIAALFGVKYVAEKKGVRVPVLSNPTETERQLKLLAQQDTLATRLGMTAAERHKRLCEGVEAMKPKPPAAPTA